jgi:hypothetical protein
MSHFQKSGLELIIMLDSLETGAVPFQRLVIRSEYTQEFRACPNLNIDLGVLPVRAASFDDLEACQLVKNWFERG